MDSKEIEKLIGLAPPPEDIFEFQAPSYQRDAVQRGVRGQGGFYFPDHAEYIPGKGCFEYFRSLEGRDAPKFPLGHVPFWDVINLLNPLKRDIAMLFRLVSAREMRYLLIPFVLGGKKRRGKVLDKLCEAFNEKALGQLQYKYIRDEYYSLPVKEIIGFTERFLVLLGVERYNAYRVSRTIGMMFENDWAYCMRFQDAMTDAWEWELKHEPWYEIERLARILTERDPNPEGMEHKYQSIVKVVKYFKWIPSVKKSLLNALQPLNIENCKLTEGDIYHTLLYGSYNIQGKSLEERIKIYESYHPDRAKWPAQWSLQ